MKSLITVSLALLIFATTSSSSNHQYASVTAAATTTTTTTSTVKACEGGACPYDFDTQSECGMWLGPSNIKKAELHGFGLGMFTGRNIPKGTLIEPLYNSNSPQGQEQEGIGEPLLPLYGSQVYRGDFLDDEAEEDENDDADDDEYEEERTIVDAVKVKGGAFDDPPLREYVWDEDNCPEVAVEYPIGLTALFIPGLASIAPCTSNNYNLELYGKGSAHGEDRYTVVSDWNSTNHGATAARYRATFVAVRDISAGEELTIQCSDDNYNGGAYFLEKYQPDNQDVLMVCLDQNVVVQKSNIQGRGLFAKRLILPNSTTTATSTILSSPVLPIHRSELNIDSIEDVNDKQLLLNYCYGHPDSDLLWLPFGPMFNYLNHSPNPNAKLQWHSMPMEKQGQQHPRQQYHHPELMSMSAETVAKTHGKTLTLDLIPLKSIQPGEEITIDYGPAWTKAYQAYTKQRHIQAMIEKPHASDFLSAEDFNRQQQSNSNNFYKTQLEQLRDPYPDNLDTYCFYALEDHNDIQHKKHRHTHAWNEREDHACLRPCQILERDVLDTQRQSKNSTNHYTYTVQLLASDDSHVIDHCILDNHDEILTSVPHSAIIILDRPFSTPVLSKNAFRMEMAFPDDASNRMTPQSWLRKKLRQQKPKLSQEQVKLLGEEFKRKKSNTKAKTINDGTTKLFS